MPSLDRLATGTPILFDGAMGTQLYAQGVPYERCFDELNLLQPDLVQAVHRAYIAAGAEVIETNTFAANRIRWPPTGSSAACATSISAASRSLAKRAK